MKLKRPLIALLSDFGKRDWFVGAMKGVLYSITPEATIVDISHDITPYNVLEGAFCLNMAYRHFPGGTVFCGVVDPGVGSEREPIVIYGDGCYYVGPNNGLFHFIIAELKDWECRIIQNSAFMLNEVSATFHGRDIFAPTAAHLAAGTHFEDAGPELRKERIVRLDKYEPEITPKGVRTRVVYIDRFGNLITNCTHGHFGPIEKIRKASINKNEIVITPGQTFGDVDAGETIAYVGSSGFLEIAVNQRNASEIFNVRVGDLIDVSLLEEQK